MMMILYQLNSLVKFIRSYLIKQLEHAAVAIMISIALSPHSLV
jgi:hypothetical protein